MKNLLLLSFAAALAAITLTSCEILEPADPGLLVPLTVDEDASLPSISVNGTRLHAETFGDPNDPVIIVLHGGPGGDYRSLLNCSKFASDGFFVVFYDQRGSGLSRRHGADVYNDQLFVEDLDAVIKHYRRRADQKLILLGQSWGAILATAYVNEHPGWVSGVVLVEPGGFTWADAEAYVKRTMSQSLFSETSNDYFYLDQILTAEDHNALDYKAALQAAADYAEGNMVGNPGPYPFWRKGAVCASAAKDYASNHPFDYRTHLGEFTARVLFLYSELNRAYGEAYARKVSAAYPDVQLVEIRGSGHCIPWFAWDRFYPAVSEYLATIK